jgi:hypothetical protein
VGVFVAGTEVARSSQHWGGGCRDFLEKSGIFSNRIQENFLLSLRKNENFP